MKSSGTLIVSASSKKSFQDSGLRDRATSPVAGSRRIKTSEPSNRYSEGRRTAWLRPLLGVLRLLFLRVTNDGPGRSESDYAPAPERRQSGGEAQPQALALSIRGMVGSSSALAVAASSSSCSCPLSAVTRPR